MTWRDLIRRALVDLRIYGAVTSVDAEDEQLGLDNLNDWIDSLKIDGLSMYRQIRTTWTLTTATSYTIGVGATINVLRPPTPQLIGGFSYVDTSVTPPFENALGPPLTDDQYASLPNKTLNSTYPDGFYYDPAYDSPNGFGTVTPWPVVTGSGLQGVIYTRGPVLSEIASADIGTDVFVPPGYRLWIRTELRSWLAGPFRVQLTDDQQRQQRELRALVKRANIRLEDLSMGVAGRLFQGGLGRSNVYTGEV